MKNGQYLFLFSNELLKNSLKNKIKWMKLNMNHCGIYNTHCLYLIFFCCIFLYIYLYIFCKSALLSCILVFWKIFVKDLIKNAENWPGVTQGVSFISCPRVISKKHPLFFFYFTYIYTSISSIYIYIYTSLSLFKHIKY